MCDIGRHGFGPLIQERIGCIAKGSSAVDDVIYEINLVEDAPRIDDQSS